MESVSGSFAFCFGDMVFFHLSPQGRCADAQFCGSGRAVSAMLLQSFYNTGCLPGFRQIDG